MQPSSASASHCKCTANSLFRRVHAASLDGMHSRFQPVKALTQFSELGHIRRIRRLGYTDERALALSRDDQALVLELGIGPLHGAQRNPKGRGNVTVSRKTVARLIAAASYLGTQRVRNLSV